MSPEEQKFPWETPTATGPFWDSLQDNHNHLGRSFLTVFGPDTIAQMPLDPSLPQEAKIRQLLTEATAHLATNPILHHPRPETLPRDDWIAHGTMVFLLARLEMEAGLTAEPEARCKAHVAAWERRFDAGFDAEIKSRVDLSGTNTLAWLYAKRGRYGEAEGLVRGLPAVMRGHPLLGPVVSPQEMGARRMLVEVLAKQGRVEEARGEWEGCRALVESMVGGKFERYVGEEREALEEVGGQLEAWGREAGV